jgi:diaminohydroxyphosphoribosylaminopyrimidine deaminase/5-amino-6-(5-phosphoribosylamino)uracil reductase
MSKHDDHFYMKRCFELALKGLNRVSPNPMVGAVIVKNNRIIGEGHHEFFGGPHAEVNAIKNCLETTEGATLYVNLEPCCHTHKKTPPCLPLVLTSGFSRVVVSNIDPNHSVAGKSIEILKQAGVEIVSDCLKEEGENLNKIFFHHQIKKKPYVHLKYAQSINGYIQSSSGRYLSNESVLEYVHGLRARYDSILVGRKTIENDNPSLTVRYGIECDQNRKSLIIIGNPDKLNGHEAIFLNSLKKLIITNNSSPEKTFPNSEIVFIKEINPLSILEAIQARGISSVLVEGGSTIIKMFMDSDFVDEYSINISPTYISEGTKILNPEKPSILKPEVKIFGDQVVFHGGR